MVTITKGDDLINFIEITINSPINLNISKLCFQCGQISKQFLNPVFPIKISFTREETLQLYSVNKCYVAFEDEAGNKTTAKGSLIFYAEEEKVKCQ